MNRSYPPHATDREHRTSTWDEEDHAYPAPGRSGYGYDLSQGHDHGYDHDPDHDHDHDHGGNAGTAYGEYGAGWEQRGPAQRYDGSGYRAGDQTARAHATADDTDRVPVQGGYDADPQDAYDDADYLDDHLYPAVDRRWIWVAGVAGAILLVALLCTVVILGGGDSGSVSRTVTATTPPAATTTAAAPAPGRTDVPPSLRPVAPVAPAAPLTPETVTTVRPEPTAPAAPPAAALPATPAGTTVTYTVTGNRQLLDLVSVIWTDAQGALQTDVNVALPWTRSVTLNPGVALSSVTATSLAGQLNCAISDGAGAVLASQNNNAMIATCTR